MFEKIFNQRFLLILAIIAGVESISYLATFIPVLNGFITAALFVFVFLLARKNILLALQISIAELIVGSKGYLFAATMNDSRISIRLAIFTAIIFSWIIFYAKKSTFWETLKSEKIIKLLILLGAIIAAGAINGLIRRYPLVNIFNDINGYFYLAMLPSYYEAIKTKDDYFKIIQVVIAGAFFVSIQTLGLAYIFFHNLPIAPYFMYKWIRLAGLGEITKFSPDAYFYRIFLQSQIYLAVGAAFLFAFLQSRKRNLAMFFVLAGIFAGLIISGSRSIWVGTAFTLGIVFLTTIKKGVIFTARYFSSVISAFIIGLALMIITVNFPLPLPQNFYAFNLFGQRLSSSEPAANTRLNQLAPLMNKIKESPLIGSGFGTEITFNSNDPRVKNQANPDGRQSAFSFEWGYLDTITEIGLFGLAVLLILISRLFRLLIKKFIAESDEDGKLITLGLILSLASIACIHIFSPYLNHPLGLGFVMLALIWATQPRLQQN